MEIDKIILIARELKASDIHMSAGLPLLFRVHGRLEQAPIQPTEEEINEMLYDLLDEKQKRELTDGYDIDFAIESSDGFRQRVNIFR